jgi:hypothetical protein
MNFSRTTPSIKQRQRGAALMIMLVIMVMGIATFFVSSLSTVALQIQRDQKTSDALAQAKEALIAYAITSENTGSVNARPGNFPCPDTDAPGTSGYGDENAVPMCAAGSIGRLPWKTLGIPVLVDGDGEPLWYAISGNFRKSVGSIINSDTKGTLNVYDNSGISLLTPPGSEAVAIVFAPGKIVSLQVRNSASDQITASNYLDSGPSAINNSTINGPFIAANKTDTFNDRLMIVRARDFMPAIEKRVAKEVIAAFSKYMLDFGKYPYPANFSSGTCGGTCNSDSSVCRGLLPRAASTPAPTSMSDWSYAFPTWFFSNHWYQTIIYSAGTNRLASAPTGCNPNLLVGTAVTPALFFMSGTPLGSYTRPSFTSLSYYLEDTENNNGDDNYVIPSATSNDSLYSLP